MRHKQSFLPGILCLYFVLVSGTTDAGNKNYVAPADTIATNSPPSFSFFPIEPQKDTSLLPKIDAAKVANNAVTGVQKALKGAVPKVAPPKASANLFKKIADVFKFRKNANENEKKRVLEIFESLGVNDSIAASAQNIKLLLDVLSVRENQHFDSLMAIINEIKARKPEPEKQTTPLPVPKKEDPIVPEPSDSKVVTDKDIEDLTNKMLPLIAEKANESKNSKEKRAALAILRKIRNGAPEVHLQTDTVKNIVKRFTLRVKNKAEVYGIHNFNKNNNYDDYKFSFLNTLVYNSLFINGKTGNIKDLNEWDSAKVITDAQKSGCKVVFTARIQQAASTDLFMSNTKSQKTFVDNTLFLLKLRNAKGVNIQLDGLAAKHKAAFTQFIKFLSEVLKIQDSTYKILVTIPAFENTDGYDLKALNQYADRFMINFSAINPAVFGPIAPLKGNQNSIETTLSRYLNADIAPEKLIVSVSYIGTKWAIPADKKTGTYIQPLTYAEIRGRYNWPVYYDDESASAMMDSLNTKQTPVRTIFFDDANSLEKKYDYIIENGLGGVSINALGYDKGYGELWDALSYKFAAIDTLYLKDSIIQKALATHLNIFEKASRYLTLFGYILNNPCQICFENIVDTGYAMEINRDLQELKIDSLIIQENKTRPLEEKFRSKFEYVNNILSTVLGYVTLFMFLVTLICACIYLYKIKSESEEWAWKKNAEIILISLCVLLVLSCFVYLFTNDSIPIFGAAPKKPTNSKMVSFSKDLTQLMAADTSTAKGKDTSFVLSDSDATFCQTDPNDACINMPFTTLMAIIGVGMAIGILITRYLIMPLLRRNDIP